MRCQQCGAPLPEGALFCPACGAQRAAPDALEEVIGKNIPYYTQEFQKIRAGEKNRFHWPAFLFHIGFCFYRKCGALAQRYFLFPLILIFSMLILTSLLSPPLSTLTGLSLCAGIVWTALNAFRLGKNFNREYYLHCQETLATGEDEKYGTSAGAALLSLLGYEMFFALIFFAVILPTFNGKSDDWETTIYPPASNANGESGLPIPSVSPNMPTVPTAPIVSDTPTAPDAPTVPNTPAAPDAPTAPDTPATPVIPAAPNTPAVPVTPNAPNIPNTSAAQKPTWCSGTYYAPDSSTLRFTSSSDIVFEVVLYRRGVIEQCTGELWGNQVLFNGIPDSSDSTSAVSGTMTYYDADGHMEVRITDSDWDDLPVRTVLTFYEENSIPDPVPTPDPPAKTPSQSLSEYILPDSDTRYISRSELSSLTAEECRRARNEIYARYGRIFEDASLQAYFNSQSWYSPTVAPDDFQESWLNDYEVANRDLIVHYEAEMGYR